jgi:hypothetical protein
MKKLLIITLLFFPFIGKSQIYVGQNLSEVKNAVKNKLQCVYTIKNIKKGIISLTAYPKAPNRSDSYRYFFNKKGICYRANIGFTYDMGQLFALQLSQLYRLDDSGDYRIWYDDENKVKISEYIDGGIIIIYVAVKY